MLGSGTYLASVGHGAGYEAGVMLGMAILFFFLVGMPIFFAVSVFQAIRTRSRGWVGVAIGSGVACLIPIVFILIGVAIGVAQTIETTNQHRDVRSVPEDRRLTTDDDLVTITVPEHWGRLKDLHEDATLQAGNLFREEYLVVLPDLKEDFEGTLEEHADITSANIVQSLKDSQRSEVEHFEINGLPATRYRISGTMDRLRVEYLHVTVEGPQAYHQVLGWTLRSKRKTALPTLEKTIETLTPAHPTKTASTH